MESQTLNMPSEGFARLPQVLHALGERKSSFYEKVAAGIYPQPIKRGRSSLWPVEQIRSVIADIGGVK